MILITGAGGKTGRAVLRQLARQGRAVRAVVRREAQIKHMRDLGAAEGIVADMCDPEAMRPAFAGISAVYHIPPNVHPEEERIGEIAIRLSQDAGVDHVVYHSVLRPYIRAMPHHLHKARVEERLFASGLAFTILQPAAYMQNTIAGIHRVREEGLFVVPYPIDTLLGMVDLDDVAEVAAVVVNQPEHYGATYELSGEEVLTPADLAECIADALGCPVEAREVDLAAWRHGAEREGMSPYQVETLLKMFHYYAKYGFWGNATTLTALLARRPRPYAEFLSGLELG